MKFYVQQGTGTGARYTEASDAMLVAAVIGILHRHGLLDTADQLTTALIHKAIGVPLPLTPLPEQLPQKSRRPRRKAEPSPEGGKAGGGDPAQSVDDYVRQPFVPDSNIRDMDAAPLTPRPGISSGNTSVTVLPENPSAPNPTWP